MGSSTAFTLRGSARKHIDLAIDSSNHLEASGYPWLSVAMAIRARAGARVKEIFLVDRARYRHP